LWIWPNECSFRTRFVSPVPDELGMSLIVSDY
jgi:hypothetical protein